MATTTVSDAAVFPQAKGTGLGSETSPVDAAGEGLLSQYHGKEYHTFSVSSRDGTNNTITLSAGIAFIEDDSSSTGGSRGTGGNPQLQSTTSSGYDTEVPENTVYVVVLPTTNTIDVADASTSQIWLNITSVTSQNSVELRSDGGGGTTAEPSDTYLKIGDFNPDDSSADSLANVDRGHPHSQALADGLLVYVGDTTGRGTIDPANTNAPIYDAIEAIYANDEGGRVYLPPGNIDHVGGSTPSGRSQGWIMRPGISVEGLGGQSPNRFATKVTRTSAGDLIGWGTDATETRVTNNANLSGLLIDMDYKNLSNATGRALVFDSAGTDTYNIWVRDLRIQNVGDSAMECDGDVYASTFGPIFTVRSADPENAAADKAIIEDTGGGVGCVFTGSNELYGHTDPASGASSNMRGMSISGGWHIDDMRFGGAITQPLQNQGREFTAGHLYWEPNPNGTPSEDWAYNFDEGATTASGGGVSIQDMTIGGGGVTVNYYVRLTGFSDSVHGPIQIPYIADRSTNTLNNQQVEIEVDLTPGCVYGGPSSDVDNNSGSSLTNSMACLDDGVYKTSTGAGYTASTDRKAGVPGLLVASNAALTLSSGSAVISTGVTTTPALFDVHLDPSGNGNNAADVKCSARAFWDNSAGEYKIEVLEDGTSVGNPDIGIEVYQTA